LAASEDGGGFLGLLHFEACSEEQVETEAEAEE